MLHTRQADLLSPLLYVYFIYAILGLCSLMCTWMMPLSGEGGGRGGGGGGEGGARETAVALAARETARTYARRSRELQREGRLQISRTLFWIVLC